ncbi:phospholipase [Luteimonas sp. WGS1318]|uniref:phospholipase n=1 Tax=Luteimonas sp. WGS1318 TaxID=3366815 RepID=UPI00372D35DD
MTSRHEAGQRLLSELRTSATDEAADTAARLQADYHAREMALLSQDSYDAARQAGAPPRGWFRATADLGALRAALPGLSMTDDQLRDLLAPERSGFRAEIYLPDPAVLGPGYKPTVVFKGSTGAVMENGVLRETAREDFLGNNLPQSLGLQTDYYDRAMRLAVTLRAQGIEFDLAGHSLGGGMASAAAAVTGMRAVTFNAAGLHPATAGDFARERGLPLYDPRETVTAWQVQGDLLNDGVQTELRGMSDLQRMRMDILLTNTVDAMRRTPAGRDYLEARLVGAVPETSQPAVRAFLDRLQAGDTAQLIRDLPEAAGVRRPALVAMTEDARALVEREDRASLGELQQLGGPVLTVLALGARGANTGAIVGQAVADGGRMAALGIEGAGDATRSALGVSGLHLERTSRGAGLALQHGALGLGEFGAQARMTGARAEAALDHAQGWAQSTAAQAPGGLLRTLGQATGTVSGGWRENFEARAERVEAAGEAARERGRADGQAAIERGGHDAQARRALAGEVGGHLRTGTEATGARAHGQLVYVGDRLDAGLEVVGARITSTTAHAPTLGAGLGGITGVLSAGALTFDPKAPRGMANWTGAIELVREMGPGMVEAVGRHGMGSAMIPSLDRHIAEQEAAARALLQRGNRDARDLSTGEPRASVWSGQGGQVLDRLLSAVRSGDTADATRATRALLDTPEAAAWLAEGQARLATHARFLPEASAAQDLHAASPSIAAAELAR